MNALRRPATSPLAPGRFPSLPHINGVRFATLAAGIRYSGRPDLMLALLTPNTSIAGVFTQSSTRAACVLDCQSKIGSDPSAGAAILVNSGNANAFTGVRGQTSVDEICLTLSNQTNIPQSRIFTCSTGVIGEPLPHERIVTNLDKLIASPKPANLESAASAIMTTDTFPKGAGRSLNITGKDVQIIGIAKGSGMIAPDMSTMLAYIFTDAHIEQSELQKITIELSKRSFNCITVDSDTSTSDTLLVCATGTSGIDVRGQKEFEHALEAVMLDLAHQIVRDGEGATKFIEVHVTRAADEADARIHALSVANSPLVKTAIAGEDPNWGRIVMAIGKSGALADRDRLCIWFGDYLVAKNGWVNPNYIEQDVANYMHRSDIAIKIDLGLGLGAATIWTCDLTKQYIDINANYRS